MGAASGGAASLMSLASVGLSAYGAKTAAAGTAAGDNYQAAILDRAAQYGELQAKQTNAEMTRKLTTTLGNIDAVRAAAHTDPSSPTGGAVRDYAEKVGNEQKSIKVNSILAQSQMDTANATYLRQAGNTALLAGNITAGADIAKGVGGLITSLQS